MAIILSNPAKLYSHQTSKVILRSHEPFLFITSFWYNPKSLFWKIAIKIIPALEKELLKKYDEAIPEKNVKFHFIGMLYAFAGRLFFKGEQRSFIEDRIHDRWVSGILQKEKADLLIGYEKSCRNSFNAAKSQGAITILDLSQVHIGFIETLRNKYPFFLKVTGNESLFNKVKSIKLEEYEMADYIFVLSDFAKQTLLENGISEVKIKVINLGFEPKRFTPKLFYNSDFTRPLRLIYTGIITQRKGIQLLLEFKKKYSDLNIELCIVGPGGDASYLLNEAKGIVYHSFLHQNEIIKLLHEADVFILPSYLDSWAMVVIEAMACGLPVIITENTGAKEAVTQECGFVIPVDDINALSEKILFFYDNRNEIKKMGLAAHKQSLSYTWDSYYAKLGNIIEEIGINKN